MAVRQAPPEKKKIIGRGVSMVKQHRTTFDSSVARLHRLSSNNGKFHSHSESHCAQGHCNYPVKKDRGWSKLQVQILHSSPACRYSRPRLCQARNKTKEREKQSDIMDSCAWNYHSLFINSQAPLGEWKGHHLYLGLPLQLHYRFSGDSEVHVVGWTMDSLWTVKSGLEKTPDRVQTEYRETALPVCN